MEDRKGLWVWEARRGKGMTVGIFGSWEMDREDLQGLCVGYGRLRDGQRGLTGVLGMGGWKRDREDGMGCEYGKLGGFGGRG
jgi:hypothetical protein